MYISPVSAAAIVKMVTYIEQQYADLSAMNWTIIVFVCLVVIGIAVVFVYTAKLLFQRKVRQARMIADLAISGEADVDEHDIWIAVEILQTEWERRKLSGDKEAHEDSRRIVRLLDIRSKLIGNNIEDKRNCKPKGEQKQWEY